MGIVEAIKKNPATYQSAGLIVVIGVLGYLAYINITGSSAATSKAYFTTDEGNSVFVDAIDRLAPFDHFGKPAYKVWMFTTDGGKTKFPGYLERCTPQGMARIQTAIADYKTGKTKFPPDLIPSDTEVKQPGAGNPWVSRSNTSEASKIMTSQVPAHAGSFEISLPS